MWLSWISLPWLLASFTLKDMDPCALTDLGSLPESVCHLKTVLTTTWLRRKFFLKNIYTTSNINQLFVKHKNKFLFMQFMVDKVGFVILSCSCDLFHTQLLEQAEET